MKMTPSRYLWLNVLLLLFCVLSKTHDRVARPVVGTDNYWQLAAAESLVNGKGITIARCDTADLAQIAQTRLVGWPPGYPVFAAPFFAFFHQDPLKTEMLVFFLAIALHFVSWFLLFKHMGGYYWEQVLPLYLLVSIFLVNPFKAMGAPTDVLSLALFSLGCLLFYRIYDYERKGIRAPVLMIAGLSVAAYGCSFFRYAYYPLTYTFTALFLLLALVQGKRYWRVGFLHAALVTGLLVAQLFYDMSGPNGMQTVNRMSSKGVLLHFEYLKYFDAIFFNAIFNDNLVYKALGYAPPIKEFVPKAFVLMFPVGAAIFLLVLAGLWAYWKNIAATARLKVFLQDNTGMLFTLATVACLINVAFITLLSLKSNSAKATYVWIWLMLTRYFVLTLFFIQLTMVLLVVNFWERKTKTAKLVVYGLCAFLVLGGGVGASQLVRLNMKMSPVNYTANLNLLYNPSGAINEMFALQQKIKTANEQFLFATVPLSENNFLTPIVAQTGTPLCERDVLLHAPKTSKPVKVLVAVQDGTGDEAAKTFCETHGGAVYERMNKAGLTIYTVTILP